MPRTIATRVSGHGLGRAYQLKIGLKDVRPPVWRRLLVSGTDSLAQLHTVLQIAMGWTDTHLHEFVQGPVRYGEPDEDLPDGGFRDELRYRVEQVLRKSGDRLLYIYDFGDNWEHEVLLEKILPFDAGSTLPVCVKGRRACPPEDVGGACGFMELLKTLADPTDPDFTEALEWVADGFDPGRFDPVEVNDLLREYCDA